MIPSSRAANIGTARASLNLSRPRRWLTTRWTRISQRLMDACDWQALKVSPDHIRRARQGYFANISYIDDKLGKFSTCWHAPGKRRSWSLSPTMARCYGRTRAVVCDELL